MKQNRIRGGVAAHLLFAAILFASTLLPILRWGGATMDDYPSHIRFAEMLQTPAGIGDLFAAGISYPVWHIAVRLFGALTGLSALGCAAAVSALFNVLAFAAAAFVMGRALPELPGPLRAALSFSLMLMGPVSAPFFNPNYYLGQGTANTWHNPTAFAVKALTVLCFWLGCKLFAGQQPVPVKRWLLFSALLFASALAKPSFLQGFLPAVGVFWLLHFPKNRQQLSRAASTALAFVPSILLLLLQVLLSFYHGISTAGIGVQFGRVLAYYTPNWLISLFLAAAFPTAVLLCWGKALWRDAGWQLCLCLFTVSWLEMALLYEKGERETHANWFWAYYHALLILWMMALMTLAKRGWRFHAAAGKAAGMPQNTAASLPATAAERGKLLVCTALFLLQLSCGMAYWFRLFTTGRYY